MLVFAGAPPGQPFEDAAVHLAADAQDADADAVLMWAAALPQADQAACSQPMPACAPGGGVADAAGRTKARRASLVIHETRTLLDGLADDQARSADLMAELEALLASSSAVTAKPAASGISSSMHFAAVEPLREVSPAWGAAARWEGGIHRTASGIPMVEVDEFGADDVSGVEVPMRPMTDCSSDARVHACRRSRAPAGPSKRSAALQGASSRPVLCRPRAGCGHHA